MKIIIIDTNILLRYPEVLSFKRTDAKLIIPDVVLDELFRHRNNRFDDIRNLIQSAQTKGYVNISSTSVPRTEISGTTAVGFVDFTVLQYLKYIKAEKPEQEVILATDDLKFAASANLNGITTFSSVQLKEFYTTAESSKDPEIRHEAAEVEKKQRFSIVFNLLIALVLLAAIVLFARYYTDIIDKLKNVALIIILVVFGFVLFEIREKQRQIYGFVEVGFGILTIIIVFYPKLILDNWDQFLKVGAGLYVIVRGLDNLYRGSVDKGLGPILKQLFGFK